MSETINHEVFDPRGGVKVLGAIGEVTLGSSANGDDKLRYAIQPFKLGGEVTFDTEGAPTDGNVRVERAIS